MGLLSRRGAAASLINWQSPHARGLVFLQTGANFLRESIANQGATLYGGVSQGASVLGASPFFSNDGVNATGISYGTITSWQFPSTGTFAAWVYIAGPLWTSSGEPFYYNIIRKTGNFYITVTKNTSETQGPAFTHYWSAVWWNTSGMIRQMTVAQPVLNVLTHVVLVVSGDDIQSVWLNGVKYTTANAAASTRDWFADTRSLANPFVIGGDVSPVSGFSGNIFETRAYNRALSDAEVLQLYGPSTRWNLYVNRVLERPAFAFYDWTTGLVGVSPISLVSAGSWVPVGSGSLPPTVQNEADALYMYSNATPPDPVTLQMPSLNTPTGDVSVLITPRIGT